MSGNSDDLCLTMHQPWASLLVHGIKRIEGRSWPAPLRGRLWIHAANKVPDPATIKAMEEFYTKIYEVNGITDLKFPERYPVSQLLGCVEVVGCIKGEELVCWEKIPEAARLEGLTNFCWLCENPQKLSSPIVMRGYQRVYNLERKIYEAAVRGISPVEGPQPVKFPLPDPRNLFSLKPGSVMSSSKTSKMSEVDKSPSLIAAIAGARAAANQYSKKDPKYQTNTVQERHAYSSRRHSDNKLSEMDRKPTVTFQQRPQEGESFKVQNTYKPPRLTTAIAANRATPTQFSKTEVKHQANIFQERHTFDSSSRERSENKFTEVDRESSLRITQQGDSLHNYKEQNVTQFSRKEAKHQERHTFDSSSTRHSENNSFEDRNSTLIQRIPQGRDSVTTYKEENTHVKSGETNSNQAPQRHLNQSPGASSKTFAAALKGLDRVHL